MVLFSMKSFIFNMGTAVDSLDIYLIVVRSPSQTNIKSVEERALSQFLNSSWKIEGKIRKIAKYAFFKLNSKCSPSD